MNRARTLLRAGLAVGLAWLLLIGSISFALAVPGHEVLSGFGGEGRLDYSAYRSSLFAPLTRGFISRILGLDLENAPNGQAGGSGDGRASATGSKRTVSDHPFTNDDFGDALSIPGIPFTAKTNTSTAKRQPGEPESCAPVGGTVWYRYRAGSDIALVANTIGTNYSAAVAVFTGSDLSGLTSIRCDSDVNGNTQVVFPARAGTTYYFQITGLVGGGDLVFNLDPLGETSRVSFTPSGNDGNAHSRGPTISADGRYVAFGSWADNLVPGDSNGFSDAFVQDRATGATTIVSISSSGELGNADSWLPSVSPDGRYVGFVSHATNLIPPGQDTNGGPDVFVHDRLTRTTTRVSVASDGSQGSHPSPRLHQNCCYRQDPPHPQLDWYGISLSSDGRYIVFDSYLNDLVRGDQNGDFDVFVHDRATGKTTCVSVSRFGSSCIGGAHIPEITPDGRYVAFGSFSSDVVAGDTNDLHDVFVRDLQTGKTTRVSVSSSGDQANAASGVGGISDDGRYVAYVSSADNLVPGDTNGGADVFVHDLQTRTTTRVSVSSRGEQQLHPGNEVGLPGLLQTSAGTRLHADLSGDGRRVAFSSRAPNLVPDDSNGQSDVFVHDRVTGTTIRISVSSTGEEADGPTAFPKISSNGLSVVFPSTATNLVSRDTNRKDDIFVHAFPLLR